MQVIVTRISKKDTDKDGNKLIGKYDKPYWKIGIQIEGSDDWYSGFANNAYDPMYLIEPGGTYSITVSEKVVGDRTFKNFKLLTPEEKEIEELREFKKQKEAESAPKADEEIDLDKF